MVLSEERWDDLSGYRDYLEHYGVKGMKWGVRKERESTGSRRSSRSKKVTNFRKRLEAMRKRKAKKATKSKVDAEKQAAKAAKKRQDILNSPTKLYKHRRDYSQEEISNALKQFKWEEELRNYSKKQMQAGKDYIDTIFQYTNSAINLYNASARIVNSFNLSEQPWKYVETAKTDKKKD